MAGVTSIEVKESLEDLAAQLQAAKNTESQGTIASSLLAKTGKTAQHL
jgi:hypothetical protein